MRKLGKFAAAFAAAAMIAVLAGCSENGGAAQQSQQTPAAQPVQSAQSSTTQNAESTLSSQKQSAQSAPASSSAEASSSAAPTSEPQSAPTEGFPEEPSEASVKYFEEAMGIVDKYLSTVMGNGDDVELIEILELHNKDENAALQKAKEYLIDCAKKGEGYLDELEKLAPTEEMSAFHNGLVKLMNILREYSDIAKSLETVDMTDEAAEEEFMGRVKELFERFNKEYKAFYVKYPIGNALDDGEWQSNGASTAQYIKHDLIGDANKMAQKLLRIINYSGVRYEVEYPNATLNIILTENSCEVTMEGGELEKSIKDRLSDDIYYGFMINETFYARVFLDENGIAKCVVLSPDGKLDESEFPERGMFNNDGEWTWGRLSAITPGGHILGGCPSLYW